MQPARVVQAQNGASTECVEKLTRLRACAAWASPDEGLQMTQQLVCIRGGQRRHPIVVVFHRDGEILSLEPESRRPCKTGRRSAPSGALNSLSQLVRRVSAGRPSMSGTRYNSQRRGMRERRTVPAGRERARIQTKVARARTPAAEESATGVRSTRWRSQGAGVGCLSQLTRVLKSAKVPTGFCSKAHTCSS